MQHRHQQWFSHVIYPIFVLILCSSVGALYGRNVKHCSTQSRSLVRLRLAQARKAPDIQKVEQYYSLIPKATDDRDRHAVVEAVRRMLDTQQSVGARYSSPLKDLLTKTINKMIYNPRYERWNKQTHQMLVDLYTPAKKYEKRVERGKSRDAVKNV